MMDGEVLADLPLFVSVADAGSFSAAASRLDQTRSAVSRAIRRLEQRLGIQLFHRTTRMLTLTSDGQAFYEHCRQALVDLHATAAVLVSGRHEATGRLKVSMPVAFGRLCVAPILIRLAGDHPRMELDLNFNDRLVDILGDGFDLAVRNGPLPDLPGLVGRHVARQRMCICAAPDYLRRAGTPHSIGELSDHQAVLYGRPGRRHPWHVRQPGGKIETIMPDSRMRFDDVEVLRETVLAGHGLSWLPRWLISGELASGALVAVLDELPAFCIDSYLLWPQTTLLPFRVRLAIEALAAGLPGRVGD